MRGEREMDYPNRKRLVLAFAVVAACSVWLAADMSIENKAPDSAKLPSQATHVTVLDPQPLKPAHQSVAIELRSRTAPVLGD
jgi:hypothetical protein